MRHSKSLISYLGLVGMFSLVVDFSASAYPGAVEPLRLEMRGDQVCETRSTGESIACYVSGLTESADFVLSIQTLRDVSPNGAIERISSDQLDEVALAYFLKADDREAIERDYKHLTITALGYDTDRAEVVGENVSLVPFVATLNWERMTGEKGSYNVKGRVRTAAEHDVGQTSMDDFIEQSAKQFTFDTVSLTSGATGFAPTEEFIKHVIAPSVYGGYVAMPVFKAFIQVFENLLKRP